MTLRSGSKTGFKVADLGPTQFSCSFASLISKVKEIVTVVAYSCHYNGIIKITINWNIDIPKVISPNYFCGVFFVFQSVAEVRCAPVRFDLGLVD